MPDNRILVFDNLSAFAAELKAKYARQTALEALSSRVDALVTAGGEPNKLEGVKVNGTALAIADKMVDILVATGSENGTISVNNANIAVAGLQALAYKAKVSEADLDTALKAVLDAKAAQSDLNAVSAKVTTLIGEDADKSVRTISAEEVAKIVAGADTAYDTLKEIADWIASHATDAAAMNSQINTNKTDIANLTALIGSLPESATSTTVVDYIAEAIGALGIGDYAKTTEVTAAINAALASYYTKTEIDNKFADYSTTTQMNAAIKVVDDKFANYSTTTEMNAAIKVVDDKLANYVLTSSVGVVTEAEVTALLAD